MCDLDQLHAIEGAHAYASRVSNASEGLWSVWIETVGIRMEDSLSLELVTYAEARAQLADRELLLFIHRLSVPALRVRGVDGPAGRWTDICPSS